MANLNSVYAQRHYETALDLFDQGLYDKAIAQIEKAISKDPDNPDYHSTKGVFLHKMNNPLRAIEAYKNALEVTPDHCFSHYNLGLIYMKQNKILKAISEWEAVIKVKPTDIDAIFNIAVALSHLGKSQESIPFYLKVIQIDPRHAQAHQNLGVIYRDCGEFAKAKHHLKQLKELDSTYVEVVQSEIIKCEEQEFLANLAKQANDYKDDCTDRDDVLSAALMALLEDDFDKAQEFATRYLNDSPEDIQALTILGQAQQGLSKSSDAIETFTKIAKIQPHNPDAMFHLGNIYLGLGELEKSLEYFERAAKLSPDYPFVKENIESIKKKLHSAESPENE
jgi:tetratricopeptide (TPR) repeat protein